LYGTLLILGLFCGDAEIIYDAPRLVEAYVVVEISLFSTTRFLKRWRLEEGKASHIDEPRLFLYVLFDDHTSIHSVYQWPMPVGMDPRNPMLSVSLLSILPKSCRALSADMHITADAITAAVLHIVYGNLSSVDVVAGVNGNTAAAYELLVFCRPYPRPIQTYGCICVL
jgi:hypothetical protein